jgi:hypothetical protein
MTKEQIDIIIEDYKSAWPKNFKGIPNIFLEKSLEPWRKYIEKKLIQHDKETSL